MAISTSAIWEVRTTGDDTNGGFYVSGGTDYSQQDAAQLTVTDGVTNGTTTVTSATGGFTAAMVGNGINIAGTIRQITAVTDTNTITVDATVAAASGQTMKVGGALASPGKAAGAMVAGNKCWIKSGTYFVDLTATANTAGGRVSVSLNESTGPTRFEGYGTTRGDQGTKPVLSVTTGSAGVYVFTSSGNHSCVENLEANLNGQSGNGFNVAGQNTRIFRCTVRSATGTGFNVTHAEECFATGCSGTTAFALAAGLASKCEARGNSVTGFLSSTDAVRLMRCIAANNSGASSVGFSIASGTIEDCTAYGHGSHGISIGQATRQAYISNTICYGNGGAGINVAFMLGCRLRNCAGGGNTSGNYNTSNIVDISGFVALTGDPFTNGAGGDFSLNNTAGAGAACRAAGVPGAFPGGTTTGYQDIGAAQHQDSGGSGSKIYTKSRIVNGTF